MAANLILLSAYAVTLISLTALVVIRRDRKASTERHLAEVIADLESERIQDAKVVLQAILRNSKKAWI